jgi:cation:H+ antiporter
MTALVIVFGFIFLLLGAEGLVDGASGLAKRLGISNLVIGMTVVAFGTSMPEFVVNMQSSMISKIHWFTDSLQPLVLN